MITTPSDPRTDQGITRETERPAMREIPVMPSWQQLHGVEHCIAATCVGVGQAVWVRTVCGEWHELTGDHVGGTRRVRCLPCSGDVFPEG